MRPLEPRSTRSADEGDGPGGSSGWDGWGDGADRHDPAGPTPAGRWAAGAIAIAAGAVLAVIVGVLVVVFLVADGPSAPDCDPAKPTSADVAVGTAQSLTVLSDGKPMVNFDGRWWTTPEAVLFPGERGAEVRATARLVAEDALELDPEGGDPVALRPVEFGCL